MRQKRLKPRSWRKSNMKTVSIVTLCLVMLAGCKASADPEQKAVGPEQAMKTVKTEKVAKQRMADPSVRAGDVQSSLQFDVLAKVGGDVEQVLKKRGDLVQEGDVIVKLNSSDLKFQRDKASLAVESAQNAISQAQKQAQKDMENSKAELSASIQKMEMSLEDMSRNYNKLRNDFDVGQATKNQVAQAEAQLKNTRMDLEQLRQKQKTLEPSVSLSDLELQLRGAEIALQETDQAVAALEVKAPVSGILTEMPVDVRMSLQQGAKVGLIQKLDPILIKAQLSDGETGLVKGKTELFYNLQGSSQKSKGKISYLSKVIEPETKTYELDVEVANKDMSLKPGMKVQLQLTEEQEQFAVAVPTYGIVKEGDDAFVFVLAGDTVEKRKLQLGRLNEPYQEVLAGVAEGELVVTSNPNQLKDKEKVQPGLMEGKP